ncbi:hypothetical protein QZM22_22785 [Burkholderia oklahomensis]|uniref:hypothetical protein n=1 Tax=Burkholderia oklahomensis TaxID=342113 RepID=UPI0026526432|nr:hypothetical protein [Burkholderia oklahomensis]MDN7675260.1 hypothetical protein [Burkholderia oklahomensis]
MSAAKRDALLGRAATCGMRARDAGRPRVGVDAPRPIAPVRSPVRPALRRVEPKRRSSPGNRPRHHLQPPSLTASIASAGIASRPMPEYVFRQSARLAFDISRASVDAAVSFRGRARPDDAPVAPTAAAADPRPIDRNDPTESRSARQSAPGAVAPGVCAGFRCASFASARARTGSGSMSPATRRGGERMPSRAAARMPRIDAACVGARCAESDDDGNGGGDVGDLGISLTINARLSGFGA